MRPTKFMTKFKAVLDKVENSNYSKIEVNSIIHKILKIIITRNYGIDKNKTYLELYNLNIYGFKKSLIELINEIYNNNICACIYAQVKHCQKIRTAIKNYRVSARDNNYFHDISEKYNFNIYQEAKLLYENEYLPWTGNVDRYHETIIVSFSMDALEDMITPIYEAYSSNRKNSYKEVYGINFGMFNNYNNKHSRYGNNSLLFIHNLKSLVHVTSKSTNNRVTINFKSFDAQMNVANSMYPYLRIVGDFHSHPYKDKSELVKNKGWMHSSADQNSNININDYLRTKYNNNNLKYSIVVAIAKNDRGKLINEILQQPNIKQFQLHDSIIVVAIYRILDTDLYDDYNIVLDINNILNNQEA